MLGRVRSRNSSVAKRLTVSLATAATVVTILAGWWLCVDAMHRAQEEMEKKAAQTVDFLQSVLGTMLWNVDDKAILEIGKTLMQDRSYAALSRSDDSGRVIFSQRREGAAGSISRVGTISHRGEIVGRVFLVFSSEVFRAQAKEVLYASLFTLVAIVVTITVCTVFLVRHFFKRPLDQLKSVALAYQGGRLFLCPGPGEVQRVSAPSRCARKHGGSHSTADFHPAGTGGVVSRIGGAGCGCHLPLGRRKSVSGCE